MTKNAEQRQDKSPITRFYDSLAPVYTWLRDFGYERDGQYKNRLINALAPFNNDVILDIGTGPGVYAMDIARQAPDSRIIGIDISEAFVRIAAERAAELQINNAAFSMGNIEALEFEDEFFTKIICAGVISVVRKREQAVRELARVLKPGGSLAVREPKRSEGFPASLLARMSKKSRIRKATSRLGLLFGHFSPDFLTGSELRSLFVEAGFSKIEVESCGPDLIVLAGK